MDADWMASARPGSCLFSLFLLSHSLEEELKFPTNSHRVRLSTDSQKYSTFIKRYRRNPTIASMNACAVDMHRSIYILVHTKHTVRGRYVILSSV